MEFKVEHAINWMDKFNQNLQANKDYLTSLDQAIGDGDHGINMARGFNEVVKKLDSAMYETVSDVFKDVAMTVISKVGGAAGPLYGTSFLKISIALKDKDIVDETMLIHSLYEGLEGIKQRGKSQVGEKTLIDVWSPVIETMKKTETLKSDTILETAKEAMENTKNITATKGRAAYFKEKSLGKIDPGAASSYYLFTALSDIVKEDSE